jgi:hypothetical protein
VLGHHFDIEYELVMNKYVISFSKLLAFSLFIFFLGRLGPLKIKLKNQ